MAALRFVVHNSKEELVPEGSRGIACELHGAGLPMDHSVEMFYPSLVCRSYRGGCLVVDTQGAAPCHVDVALDTSSPLSVMMI